MEKTLKEQLEDARAEMRAHQVETGWSKDRVRVTATTIVGPSITFTVPEHRKSSYVIGREIRVAICLEG